MIFKVLLLASVTLAAAKGRAAYVNGQVVDRLGAPVPEATVIVQSTWATATTTQNGFFTVELPAGGSVLRITAMTGETVTVDLAEAPAETLRVALPLYATPAVQLDTFVVLPSRFPVGEMPGAQMSSIDAVLTPGSLADFNRALQTLPGADAQDEGDALYVRGGDAFETGVFINGARYQQIRDEDSPLGTFVGSINPFLAESIRFEAGGFGASRGNLLSAVVDVETVGRPAERTTSLNVGLGAVSGGFGTPLGDHGGFQATATRRDVRPILSVNGSNRTFLRAPNGHDFSLLGAYEMAGGGQAKAFGIEQTDTMALEIEDAGKADVYRTSNRRRQAWGSLTREFDGWDARLDVSWADSTKNESTSYWTWRNATSDYQALGRVSRRLAEKALVGAGFDGQITRGDFRESIPSWSGHHRLEGRRLGVWSETDWMLTERWRAVTGWRLDHSNLGGGTTSDPRAATGYRLAPGLDLSVAWGVYHQRPELLAMSWLRGGGPSHSARARHHIVALAFERGRWQGRLEAYRKEYDRLWIFTPQRGVREGKGSAQGVELSGKFPLPEKWRGRVSVAITDAERTDARTGVVAPYGIGYSSALVLQRSFGHGIELGLTWRQASGKRYTAVEGGVLDPDTGEWSPVYGDPNGAELRSLQRLDLLLSRIQEVNTRVSLITYLSVSNVLGRANEYEMAYSPDYRSQTPVRSMLSRIIYAGFTLQFR